ncbi:PEP-CTERM sorting domain-containing protein [Methylobacillus glycogenes]|uniref:PEP-CTERM sorting domain-containing protein n=1 Tax=Methylobacillus glycogenes TaxID=406 RepID=UPI0004723247|nr:PEP-CTERM sorting domain-containing protein [Methylobacillus glycogenes]
MKLKLEEVALVIISIFSFSSVAYAESRTWFGGMGSWNDSTNWLEGVVPTSQDHVIVNSGTIQMNGDVEVKIFTQNGGLVAGTGNLTTQSLSWISGNFHTGGTITVNGDSVLGKKGSVISLEAGSGAIYCDSCSSSKLVLNGNTTLSGSLWANVSAIENNGTLTLRDGGGNAINYMNRSAPTFLNKGTILVDPGADGRSSLYNLFANNQKVEVRSGTLDISGFSNAEGGELKVNSGVNIETSGIFDLSNSGGKIEFGNHSTLNVQSFFQSAGTTILNNVTFNNRDRSQGLTLTGGELKATGSIVGYMHLNGGELSLGDDFGILELEGDVNFTKDASLRMKIGGVDPGISHDYIDAEWALLNIFGGAINIDFLNDYAPTHDTTYILIHGAWGWLEEIPTLTVTGLDSPKYSYELIFEPTKLSHEILPGMNVKLKVVVAIPEPSTYAMLGLGIGFVGIAVRRRKSRL